MIENKKQGPECLTQCHVPNTTTAPDVSNSICEIPTETAPEKVRLDSPGYLLLHPELTGKAIRKTIFSSAVQLIAFMTAFGYILAEIRASLYLLSHYGFIR